MRTITISNDFHNTECNLRVNESTANKYGEIELTQSQIKRCKRVLCGMSDCRCGGPIGNRGHQNGIIVEQIDYDRVVVSLDNTEGTYYPINLDAIK